MTTHQWHRYSGTFLSLYITQHLLNHLMALHSPQFHILMMDYTRTIYRQWAVEVLRWAAVLVQVYTGIRLSLKGSGRGDIWARWQRYSGLYLAFFLLMHTSAVLYGRFGLGVDTNFWYGAAVVQNRLLAFFFTPYYALAILAYGTHMSLLFRFLWLRNNRKVSLEKIAVINRRTLLWVGVFMILTIGILWGIMRPMDLPAAYRL